MLGKPMEGVSSMPLSSDSLKIHLRPSVSDFSREVCELVYKWNFRKVCYALINNLPYEKFLINHDE